MIIGEHSIASAGVEYRGFLAREEVKKELEDANLLVMPSYIEAFGVPFVEAMAFWTPCIGSDVEAIPEIIENGGSGFIVRAGDIASLASSMLEVLTSVQRAREMGVCARKIYEKRYRWSDVISKIDCVLRDLAHHGKGGSQGLRSR